MANIFLNILFCLSFIVADNSDDIPINTLEYHLALACAANAASSRHLAFFARFQLVKDSCRSTALLADAITAKQAIIVNPIIM